MASLQQVNEALNKVMMFLEPLAPLVGCHMVDYLTLKHWDTLLPTQLQKDLLHVPADSLHHLPLATLSQDSDPSNPESESSWNPSCCGLSSFLAQIRRHSLAALGVTTPMEQIVSQYCSAEIDVLPMKGIMSLKKTHEVEVMSDITARLAKGLGVPWLVDIGSGRGYLSTSLVLQYSQHVVAIDSSSSNTSSALARNTKLKRFWDNLRRTAEEQSEGRAVKKGKTRRRRRVTTQQQQQNQQEEKQQQQNHHSRNVVMENGDSLANPVRGRFFGMTKFVTEDTDLLQLVKYAFEPETTKSDDKNEIVESDGELVARKVNSEEKTHPSEPDNTTQASRHHHNTVNGNTDAFTSTTNTTTENQTQNISLGVTSKCHSANETPVLGMVGLHTCGNLASNSLKLFLKNPTVKFICNVGCCYHLIEEEFSRNTYNQNKVPDEPQMKESPFLVYNGKDNCAAKHEGEEQTMKQRDTSSHSSSHNSVKGNTDIKSVLLTKDESVSAASSVRGTCLPLTTLPCNPPQQHTTQHHPSPSNPPQQHTTHHHPAPSNPPQQHTTHHHPSPTSTPQQHTTQHNPTPLPSANHDKATAEGDTDGDIDPLHPSRIPNLGYGFPLSSMLIKRRFSLGRNSRMLSSQAAERLNHKNTGNVDPLYWRALLQVVLEDKLSDVSHLSHVGRLAAKCDNFKDYARIAMAARLGVSLSLTDEELEEYDEKHRGNKDKLERFFLLRASLAAVVEGAILLDRLAFLCQQEGVSAYLVPMFDPVTSPRSHAIIAVRNTSNTSLRT